MFAAGIAALIVLALISAAVGQVPTTPVEVAGSFFHRIGLDWGPMPAHPAGDVTLWEVRFPRVVMAILVGAALATAGALLQGVFANPLAEPGVIGVGAAVLMAAKLDLLALGESAARHLGVDVERLRRNVIVVVAVLATAGVAFTGIILFVGLIVPHLVRMLVGPAHRVLIPLSAILGAVVLLAADIGALALVHNADLPLGMLTSLVGGPFFFWLLRRTRARSGGWA
nr:iron ABC transporter permease [Nocardia crassostreae]